MQPTTHDGDWWGILPFSLDFLAAISQRNKKKEHTFRCIFYSQKYAEMTARQAKKTAETAE